MDKEYYKEYFNLERNHWWFKVREKIIEDKLKQYAAAASDLTILNIGAATGRSSEMLQQFGNVTSIEFDEECYEFTRQKVNIPIDIGSILDLQFPSESFDLVCAFDVIEHVEDDGKAVSEMKRVCKMDGVICITIPAFMQLWSHHDEVNHHYRRYRMQRIVELFSDSKGRILFNSYFNSLLFLPIYLFRLISGLVPNNWIRKGSGSDFSINSNNFINTSMYHIFSFERFLLKKLKFNAGVSILFLWKK